MTLFSFDINPKAQNQSTLYRLCSGWVGIVCNKLCGVYFPTQDIVCAVSSAWISLIVQRTLFNYRFFISLRHQRIAIPTKNINE